MAPPPRRSSALLVNFALLLGDLYHRAGLGLTPGAEHRALADYLGCHPEVQAVVWDLWQVELLLTRQDLGEAGALARLQLLRGRTGGMTLRIPTVEGHADHQSPPVALLALA